MNIREFTNQMNWVFTRLRRSKRLLLMQSWQVGMWMHVNACDTVRTYIYEHLVKHSPDTSSYFSTPRLVWVTWRLSVTNFGWIQGEHLTCSGEASGLCADSDVFFSIPTSWYILIHQTIYVIFRSAFCRVTIVHDIVKEGHAVACGVAVQTSPISHLAVQAFCDGYFVSPWWPTPGIVFVGLPTPVVTGLSPSRLVTWVVTCYPTCDSWGGPPSS